jgi:pilus assembly protein CpaC
MSRGLSAFLAAALAALPAQPQVFAQQLSRDRFSVEPGRSNRIQMGVGKSVVIDLPQDASEIIIGNPGVANAVVRTPRKLYVTGAGPGQTTIFAVDAHGQRFANYEFSVGRDVGELEPLLRAAIPTSKIVARTVNDSIILTGTVGTPGDAQRAVDIAKGFASKVGEAASGGVINSLIIRGEDQVTLRVTVAEVSRNVLKQLGVSPNGDKLLNGSWGTFSNNNPFGIQSALSTAGLALNGPTGTGTTLSIQAYERYNVARILAEPSVTAVSGEAAKVMVGGEIAVPGGGTCSVTTAGATTCSPSVAFKPYGISLNFTPVVQSEGRIVIHVTTEVTEIDYSTSFAFQGTTTPGFKNRKNETTVELPSGGSMATAGLISSINANAISGLPGIMNLPVLGALFRSRDYQRQETELLIIVTPYIVKPITPQQVVRPDDNLMDPSDPQAWLLGRVNRIYATRNNPELNRNYKGQIGFIHD